MRQVPAPGATTSARARRADGPTRGRERPGPGAISVVAAPVLPCGAVGRTSTGLTSASRLTTTGAKTLDRHGPARRTSTSKAPTSPTTSVDTGGLAGRRAKKPSALLASDLGGRHTARPLLELRVMVEPTSSLGAPRPALQVRRPLLAHPHPAIPRLDVKTHGVTRRLKAKHALSTVSVVATTTHLRYWLGGKGATLPPKKKQQNEGKWTLKR